MKTRNIATVVRDLRDALGLTQQNFATAMESAISTVVRYEHGRRPTVQQLSKMLELARAKELENLAAELQLHLNAMLGPAFPITPDPNEQLCVWLARRINQNPKRRDAFFKWAAPEMEQLKAENELRKERSDEQFADFDAYVERVKEKDRGKGKKGGSRD